MINNFVFRVKKSGEIASKCFCKNPEKIENYFEAISSDEKFDCHHRLETHFSDGTKRPKNAQLNASELKALGMYYDRPAEELIFIKHSEHTKLHHKGLSKPKSKDWAKKHSDFMKGREPWNKGLHTGPQSEDSNKKRSEKLKGRHWHLENGKRIWDKNLEP